MAIRCMSLKSIDLSFSIRLSVYPPRLYSASCQRWGGWLPVASVMDEDMLITDHHALIIGS